MPPVTSIVICDERSYDLFGNEGQLINRLQQESCDHWAMRVEYIIGRNPRITLSEARRRARSALLNAEAERARIAEAEAASFIRALD